MEANDSSLDFSWVIPILVAAIPALVGFAGALVQREAVLPRPYRRLNHVANMLAATPPDSKSRTALDDLLASMIEPLSQALSEPKKTLNPYNLFWTIVFALISGFAMFLLVQWVFSTAGDGWNVLAWIVTIVVGLAFSVFIAAAISTLYNPVLTKAQREERKAAKQQ